jgi:uncharacterized integral membrane protein
MRRFWQRLGDFWEAVVSFVGAIMFAVDIVYQMATFGFLSGDFPLAVGLLLAVIFGLLAIQKAVLKSRENQGNKTDNSPVSQVRRDGFVAQIVKNSPIVKAEGQGKAAGGDIVETHNYYGQNEVLEKDQLIKLIGVEAQRFIAEFYKIERANNRDVWNVHAGAEKILDRITTDFLYQANVVLRDTDIPSLINQLKNEFSDYGSMLNSYTFNQEEKYGYIRGRENVPQQIEDELRKLSLTLQQKSVGIGSTVKRLVDYNQTWWMS